ncbi:hypothetical protein HKX48_001973 [Thoreauomyces humboldtii]|nr:hypothetical protein HKX48_001973 [Thoreauomyces humboldtii]
MISTSQMSEYNCDGSLLPYKYHPYARDVHQHHHQHQHLQHHPHQHQYQHQHPHQQHPQEFQQMHYSIGNMMGEAPTAAAAESLLPPTPTMMLETVLPTAADKKRGKRPSAAGKRKRQGNQASQEQLDAAGRKLRELEAVIREHLGTGKFFLVAAALREIDEEKLFAAVLHLVPTTVPAAAKSIYTYAKERFSFSRRTTNTYLCSASVYESLVEDGALPVPVNISHIRSLHKFPADVRRFIWKQVCDSGHTITEEHVVAMTVKYDLNNELYTPKAIISAGKVVIHKATFDLDPASCEFANDKIHEGRIATEFFDEGLDGVNQIWHGDVWLSPPLGQEVDGSSQQSRWFCAAEHKFRIGEIASVMVLLKVDFGTAWFRRVQNYPHCFFNSKLSFSTPTGREKCMQDESHVLVYMGANVESFCAEFSRMGSIPGWNSWSFRIQKDPLHRDLFADAMAPDGLVLNSSSDPGTPVTTPQSHFGMSDEISLPSSQTSSTRTLLAAATAPAPTTLANGQQGDIHLVSGVVGAPDGSPEHHSVQFQGFLHNFALNEHQLAPGAGMVGAATHVPDGQSESNLTPRHSDGNLGLGLGAHGYGNISFGSTFVGGGKDDLHFGGADEPHHPSQHSHGHHSQQSHTHNLHHQNFEQHQQSQQHQHQSHVLHQNGQQQQNATHAALAAFSDNPWVDIADDAELRRGLEEA